jgi:F-type H+-transporting ATPase subunit a
MLVPAIIVFFALFVYIFIYIKDFSIVSTLLQFIFASLVTFVLKIVTQQVGKRGYVFFPLVFTFFLLLLCCNLLSLTPFSLAITSHINIIAYMTFSVN